MFPTPHTVVVHPFVEGATDPRGNPTPGFGPDRVASVYGWAPAQASEPTGEPRRDEVVADLDLLVPPTFSCGPRDEITVAGDRYAVVGHPEEFNHGPFAFAPGSRVNLRRVEG